jgi:hypothetical protein
MARLMRIRDTPTRQNGASPAELQRKNQVEVSGTVNGRNFSSCGMGK